MRAREIARLHVVLHRPIIPFNTGNVGRTCLGFGAQLHLIAPQFDVNDKAAKRAGLDYWPKVQPRVHACWQSFERDALRTDIDGGAFLFSKEGKQGEVPLAEARFFGSSGAGAAPTAAAAAQVPHAVALVFGSEHAGLEGVSEDALRTCPCVYLPMSGAIRSYNLSSAAAMGVWEAHRQLELCAADRRGA